MDFELTQEQKAIREAARRFADSEIAPVAKKNDEEHIFPWDIINKMGELGYLAGPLPPEYGGSGMDYIAYAILTEEIGRACSSVRTVLSVHSSLTAHTIWKWGTEEQKREILPKMATGEWIGCFGLTEPDAGSDPASLRTRAVKDGDHWILNGTKMWISNGGVARIALIFAQTDPGKKHKGIVAFMVDTQTEGFSSREIPGKLGLWAASTAELIMEDVRVPDSMRLGEVGEGFRVAMSALDMGRYSVAAGCVGICQASLEAAVSYAKERVQFGKPIASFQLVQALIAEIGLDTEAARLLARLAGAGRPADAQAPSRDQCIRTLEQLATWRGQVEGKTISAPLPSAAAAVGLWEMGAPQADQFVRAAAAMEDSRAGDYIAWHLGRTGSAEAFALGMAMLPALDASPAMRVYNDSERATGAMLLALSARTDEQKRLAAERITARLEGGLIGAEDNPMVRSAYRCGLVILGRRRHIESVVGMLDIGAYPKRRVFTALCAVGERAGADWLLWSMPPDDEMTAEQLGFLGFGDVLAVAAPALPPVDAAAPDDLRFWQVRILRTAYAVQREALDLRLRE